MFVCVCGKAFTAPSHTCTRTMPSHAHTPASALPDLRAFFLTFLTPHDVESFYRLSTIRLFSSGVFFLGKALGYLFFLPSALLPKRQGSWGGSVPRKPWIGGMWILYQPPWLPFPASPSRPVLGVLNSCASLRVLTWKQGQPCRHKPGMGINGRLCIWNGFFWPAGL